MSGNSSGNQTSTQTIQYPPWLEAAMSGQVNAATNLYNQQSQAGYQPYTDDRIADFNPYQQQAFTNIAANQGMWQPFLQSSADGLSQANSMALGAVQSAGQNSFIDPAYAGPATMAQSMQIQAGSLPQANLDAYMNPYTAQVTNRALGDLEQQRMRTNLANSDAATKAKAFGGSRHGVVEAMTNDAYTKQAADLATNAAQSNFLNAQNMAQTDLQRQFAAQQGNQNAYNAMAQFNAGNANDMAQFNANLAQEGSMFNAQNAGNLANIQLGAAGEMRNNAYGASQIGSMLQSLYANDNTNLLNAGNAIQDQQQSILDFGYQQWREQQAFPWELLNRRAGITSGTSYAPNRSESQPIYRNRAAGFLGGAAQGYNMFGGSDNPYAWVGALGGGLLGGWGG